MVRDLVDGKIALRTLYKATALLIVRLSKEL